MPESALQSKDWYENLIDDCRAIVVECEFASRWALVEGYHALGKRLLEEHANFERHQIYGGEVVQRVSEDIGKSPSTIWRSIQFARKFDDLGKLPEGKNTSWHQICQKYLPTPSENPQEEREKGLVSQSDLSHVKDVVLAAANLCELLDAVDYRLLCDTDKDFLKSQLKMTTGKIARFLLNNDALR